MVHCSDVLVSFSRCASSSTIGDDDFNNSTNFSQVVHDVLESTDDDENVLRSTAGRASSKNDVVAQAMCQEPDPFSTSRARPFRKLSSFSPFNDVSYAE